MYVQHVISYNMIRSNPPWNANSVVHLIAYVCIYIYIHMSMYLSLSIYLSLSLYIYIYIYTCVCIHTFN